MPGVSLPVQPRARLRPVRARLLIVTVLLASAPFAPSNGRCQWQTYTSQDGLPGSSRPTMLEDSTGALWFGSFQQFAIATRFDGVTWRQFGAADGMGLQGPALPLLLDRHRNVWFGSPCPREIMVCPPGPPQVARFDGSAWVVYTLPGPSLNNGIASILEDRQGRIWAGGDGLYQFDGIRWSPAPAAPPAPLISDLCEDAAGRIWCLGGSTFTLPRLLRFDGTAWVDATGELPRNPATGQPSYSVTRLFKDRDGVLWASTTNGPAWFDGTTWTLLTAQDGLPSLQAEPLLTDRTGATWFSIYGGVARRSAGGRWISLTTANGLANAFVSQMLQDQQGSFWFSTGTGVNRWNGTRWDTLTVASGLPANYVRMLRDRRGDYWFMAGIAGVSLLHGTQWTRNVTGYLGAPLEAIAAAEDSSGNIWFATSSGLQRFNPDSTSTWAAYTSLSTGGGLPDDFVSGVAVDRGGGVWASTGGAVTLFDGTAWRTIDRTSTGRSLAIYPARDGTVWIGTDHSPYSLVHYNGTAVDSLAPMGADSSLNVVVPCITEDSQGNLWVGTDRYGVLRRDPSGWTQYPLNGSQPAGAWTLLGDREGGVWVSILDASGCVDVDGNECPLGLSHFDGSRWRSLSTSEGLPSASGTPSSPPAFINQIIEDSDGSIWLSTPGCLARYEPDRAAPQTVINPVPPPILGTRSLTLGFVAAYGETRGIQYSYSIDGGPWSEWTTTTFWQGANLADGVHDFQVRARDDWGNVDPTPARQRFEVDATPPLPVLSYPGQGAVVRGAISIRGAAFDARFRSYRVDVRAAGASSWAPPVATQIVQSGTPVMDGQLATWDTTPLPDGLYDLRVSVVDSLGLVGIAQATVVVDNHFPYASETAPAKVVAQTGGDVYTTGSELHLYFPPRAFAVDALVTVTPLAAAAADTLPGGAVRIAPGWEIFWGAPDLRKPATLEISYAGAVHAPGVPAVYISSNGTAWTRLGGSVNPDAHTLSLPVTRAGQYALFAESGVILGESTLSGVSFTPRVFSPAGTFADRRVGIGFSLGRPGFVTVRVYSRSGRLVREVVSHQWMNTGANTVHWDGTDRGGGYVTDGLYLVAVEALGQKETKPLAVVK